MSIVSNTKLETASFDSLHSAASLELSYNQALTSMELQVQQLVRGQRDLVDKVNAASQAVASLRVSLAGKVDDNSEAIASMDAYRVAVNSRLAEIERRLGTGAGLGGR